MVKFKFEGKVSTHSRLKAAGLVELAAGRGGVFQHTAA